MSLGRIVWRTGYVVGRMCDGYLVMWEWVKDVIYKLWKLLRLSVETLVFYMLCTLIGYHGRKTLVGKHQGQYGEVMFYRCDLCRRSTLGLHFYPPRKRSQDGVSRSGEQGPG